MRRRIRLPPEPAAMTDDERVSALEIELLILKPYASTEGLRKLKERVREIDRAIHRLRGLPY